MKVIALLSWYDEPASWLAATVASVSKLCEAIVAVDGAYASFPGALRAPKSGAEQRETILSTAAALDMAATVNVPGGPWWSGEVGKREFLFRLADTIADEGDWMLEIDADERLHQCPADAREVLADAGPDVAEITIWTRPDWRSPIRRLFRGPGVHIESAHYVHRKDAMSDEDDMCENCVTPWKCNGPHILQGRVTLAGPDQVEAFVYPAIVLEHVQEQRNDARREQKRLYALSGAFDREQEALADE